jgi:hypothetical protein
MAHILNLKNGDSLADATVPYVYLDESNNVNYSASAPLIAGRDDPNFLAALYSVGLCAHENYMTQEECDAAVGNFGSLHRNWGKTVVADFSAFSTWERLAIQDFFSPKQRENGYFKIIFPSSLTSISATTYRYFDVDHIIMNNTFTYDSEGYTGSTSLFHRIRLSLVIKSPTPPTMNDKTIPTTIGVYVPDDAVNTYKTDSYWSTYASQIYSLTEWQETYGDTDWR